MIDEEAIIKVGKWVAKKAFRLALLGDLTGDDDD